MTPYSHSNHFLIQTYARIPSIPPQSLLLMAIMMMMVMRWMLQDIGHSCCCLSLFGGEEGSRRGDVVFGYFCQFGGHLYGGCVWGRGCTEGKGGVGGWGESTLREVFN